MKYALIAASILLIEPAVASDNLYISSTGLGMSSSCHVYPDSSNRLMCSDDDQSMMTRAAQWAVDIQLRNWLTKKPKDLTRDELNDAYKRMNNLEKWALKLDNKVFSNAYMRWDTDMRQKLDARRKELDKEEIAKTILLGLPQPPEDAK